MIYVIADTHFGHKNIIEYENRPFKDTKEMDITLINNWNSVVDKNDTVLHLGDVFFCNTERQFKIMNQLNGKKILIKGNHDKATKTKYNRLGFTSVHKEFYIDNLLFTHKPKSVKKYFNIHGHIHSNIDDYDDNKHLCVSVEMINYTPISLDEIKNIIKIKLN